MESKLRGDIPIDREGAIFDITIHGSGTPRFSGKITKIVEAKSMGVEFVGDFVGTGEWKFEATMERRRCNIDGTSNPRDYRLFSSPHSWSWKNPFRRDVKRIQSIEQLPEQEVATLLKSHRKTSVLFTGFFLAYLFLLPLLFPESRIIPAKVNVVLVGWGKVLSKPKPQENTHSHGVSVNRARAADSMSVELQSHVFISCLRHFSN